MGSRGKASRRGLRIATAAGVASLFLSLLPASATPLIITSAGGGLGDTGAARLAKLSKPRGVATDGSGNLYIADTGSHKIRRVNSAGFITTFSGTGVDGFSDADGYAVNAQMSSPSGVAVDPSGNVYVADTGNDVVRKISGGQISTVAGTPNVSGFSGDGSSATSATLFKPWNIAPDGTGLTIADNGNDRIRRVDFAVDPPVINTIAGGGSPPPIPSVMGCETFVGDGLPATLATLDAPEGVASGLAGLIYLSDTGDQRVRQIEATTNVISTTAGACLASQNGSVGQLQELNAPSGVAADSSGNVYVTDREDNAIWQVSVTNQVTMIAGAGACGFRDGPALSSDPSVRAQFCNPSGIALFAGSNPTRLFLYVADTGNDRIRKIDLLSANKIVTTVAGGGVGDDGAPTNAFLGAPAAVAFDADGNLYVADSADHRVRKVSPDGSVITTFAGTGTAGTSPDGGQADDAMLNSPSSVTPGPSGSILIADTANHIIRKVASNGTISTVAGKAGLPGYLGDGGSATNAKLNTPIGIAVVGNNLYIADSANNRIRWVNLSTNVINTVVGTGAAGFNGDGSALSTQLNIPSGVALDSSNNLLIADSNNKRVRKVTPGSDSVLNRGSGENVTTVAGNDGTGSCGPGALTNCLDKPWNIIPNGTSSSGFSIADAGNHRVWYVDPTGNISVEVGTGTATGSIDGPGGNPADDLGDGGSPLLATLNAPQGVARDANGNLYIADTGNGRVREVG